MGGGGVPHVEKSGGNAVPPRPRPITPLVAAYTHLYVYHYTTADNYTGR